MTEELREKPSASEIPKTEYVYKSSEIAKKLNISVPTVRKYALILEKHEYQFEKSESGERLFKEKDILALSELKNSETTLEKTAKRVSFEQKQILGDITETQSDTIHSVSTGDTPAEIKEEEREIAQYNPRYGLQTKEVLQSMRELAASQQNFVLQLVQQNEKQNEAIRELIDIVRNLKEEVADLKQARKQDKKKWWNFGKD